MSYSLRMKVLKRICMVITEEQVNNLFEALLNRYGLFIAKQFLSFCTTGKIVNILKMYDIDLHAGHLKRFFTKDKTILLVYIEELRKRGKEFNDKKFIQHVAETDVEFFLELKEKYRINALVGRRTSKKIIDLKKDDVVANPKSYVNTLKQGVVSRTLKKDFAEFYLNLFRKTEKKKYRDDYECNKFLKHAPLGLQYKIMSNTYKVIYNEDMLENADILSEDILSRLAASNLQRSAMIARDQYEKTNKIKFLKYIPVSTSIPILKDKISLTSSISNRSRLIRALLDICRYHNDLKSLEDVMTYFCKRHRNDNTTIRSEFLRYIFNEFPREKFNNVHWMCLVDLHKLEKMNDEYLSERTLLFRYMEYLVKNNRPIKEYFDIYIKEIFEYPVWLELNENSINNPDLYKTVLLEVVNRMPLEQSEDYQEEGKRRAINYILKFNKKFPDLAIDVYSIQMFVDNLKNKNMQYHYYEHIDNIQRIICKKNRNQIESEILDCYFSSQLGAHPDIFKWFLKHDVCVIVEYFDNLIAVLIRNNTNYWYKLRKFSHLGLDKKSVAYLKKELNSDEKSKRKTRLVKPLVNILSPREFVSLTERYIPKTDKINLQDNKNSEMYILQCKIAKSLKCVAHKPSILQSVLNYCKGDYVNSVISSLYSTIAGIPENEIPAILNNLFKRGVSVRKHAVFLSCNTLEKKLALEILKKAGLEEQNVSLQKHLYSTSMKYFCKNPSEDAWNVMKVFINFIDKSDVESLKKLSELCVSNRFRCLYWVTIWEFFEYNKAIIPNSYLYKISLLKQIDKDLLGQLPIELLKNIIKEYFLGKTQVSSAGPLIKFTVLFLLCEKRMDTFKLIFDMIACLKQKTSDWMKNTSFKRTIKKIFNEFVSQRNEDYFTDVTIDRFSYNWYQIFPPVESFKQYIMLSVLKMYKKSNNDMKIFSKQLSSFLRRTVDAYGFYVLSKLVQYVKYNLELLISRESKIILIENILKQNKGPINCAFCLQLLPQSTSRDKDKVDTILKQIMDNEDPFVEIFCNLHMGGQ